MKYFYTLLLVVLFLSGTASAKDLVFTWTANIEPDIAGYTLYYGDAPDSTPHDVEAGLPPTNDGGSIVWTFHDAPDDAKYYALDAYDSQGNRSAKCEAILADPVPVVPEDFNVIITTITTTTTITR